MILRVIFSRRDSTCLRSIIKKLPPPKNQGAKAPALNSRAR